VWIVAAGWPIPDTRRLDELAGPLVAARADSHPEVAWGHVIARRHADRLGLQARTAAPPQAPLIWAWRCAPELTLPDDLGVLALEPDSRGPIDAERLPDDMIVRWRRGGERLRPRRGGPRRALKSLLQEARIAPTERARLPLLFAGTQLLAVGDRWSDASIHAPPRARRRVRILWRHD
jgi:tRNA(Ile)-lysidine synthase